MTEAQARALPQVEAAADALRENLTRGNEADDEHCFATLIEALEPFRGDPGAELFIAEFLRGEINAAEAEVSTSSVRRALKGYRDFVLPRLPPSFSPSSDSRPRLL